MTLPVREAERTEAMEDQQADKQEEQSNPKTAEKRPKGELSGRQRKQLRGLAHHLSPLVHIGHEGLSDGVVDALTEVLDQHELVKVRVLESAPNTPKELAEPIAERCGAHVAGTIGRIVIVYRRHKNKPQIPLITKTAKPNA